MHKLLVHKGVLSSGLHQQRGYCQPLLVEDSRPAGTATEKYTIYLEQPRWSWDQAEIKAQPSFWVKEYAQNLCFEHDIILRWLCGTYLW